MGNASDVIQPVEDCSWCTIFYKLTDDLLVEILCRLPENLLIRCKLVCKSWHTLITNVCVPKISTFAPLCGFVYSSRNLESEKFIEYASYVSPPAPGTQEFVQSYSSLLPFKHSHVDMLDCCNGLLLIVRGSIPEYYVCNPTTKQCVAIPRDDGHVKAIYAALAFNPCKSPHYKVVRFDYTLACSISNPPRLDIFSSETGKWVTHQVPIEAPIYGLGWVKRTVCLDVVLYRLSYSKYLLCFDLNEVNARAIELPEKDRTDEMGFIGASRGYLYYSNHDESKLFIWMLEDHGKVERWILMHSICIDDFAEHPLGRDLYLYRSIVLPWFKLYALHPNSEVIFLGTPFRIVGYHHKGNKFEIVHTIGRGKSIFVGQFSVFPYSRCLVVLKDFVPKHCGSTQLGMISKNMKNLMLQSASDELEQSKETELLNELRW